LLKKTFKIEELNKNLKNYKKLDNLKQFLKNLLKNFDVEFIILFGSLAKGTWNYRSDIDLLIVSNSINGDYFERLLKVQKLSPGGIDIFLYTLNEFEEMLNNFRLITIEPLASGQILYDKGIGLKLMQKVKMWIKTGILTQVKNGWKINLNNS